MKFEPRPANRFPQFIETYYQCCKTVCPKLVAIAGKWTLQDLIPGLSDFDTRLIFRDGVSLDEWHAMSLAVGRVHTQLAREHPRWARILEHLPGLNLMAGELTDPVLYYPEFQQWTFYQGDSAVIDRITQHLQNQPWQRRDELFHLKKFALYYGPYQHGIDPPINLGPWENKYILHSRYMHYFAPPIQSAVSLIEKRGIAGKRDALQRARDAFPNPQVIDTLFDTLDQHYETPKRYDPVQLASLERDLDQYLQDVYKTLAKHTDLITVEPTDTVQQLQAKTRAIEVDPAELFFEGTKFSRFMKGRLLFFAEQIDWFDSEHLIGIELGRIVNNFYAKPLVAYGLAKFGQTLTPEDALAKLRGNLLSNAVCDGLQVFTEEASKPLVPGQERAQARRVAEVFNPVLELIEHLGNDLRQTIEHQTSQKV